jgi:hypothetical protein
MLIKCPKVLREGELKSAVFDLNSILKFFMNYFGSLVQPLVDYKAGADYYQFG